MRIAFTGGGTGGHVLPNIAIIDEIKSRKNLSEIFYIGGSDSVEQELISRRNIPFFGIQAGKLRRYFDLKNFADFFRVPIGIVQSLNILRKKRPDLLFAKGGYVSVPVVLAAWLLKIPVWIHESDATPGLSTRICLRFASKVFVSFEESKKFFRAKNVQVVGNPVRKSVLNGDKKRGFELTGFDSAKPTILIMGGSTGASSLNNLVYEILQDLLKIAQVIHITGRRGAGKILAGYKQFAFLDEELADCYAISDLVVSRAGSGGIFEVLALQIPLVLVPLPKEASRGDQIENAAIFEERGFAVSVDQEKIKPEDFFGVIKNLLGNEKCRLAMIENQKKSAFKNAAGKIAEELLRTC